MNIPSRLMPPIKARRELDVFGSIGLLAIVVTVVAWAAFMNLAFQVIFGTAAALYAVLVVRSQRHRSRVKAERRGESICDFAKALPARAHDTWVVRAVYEELSRNREVALRPIDRLVDDLGFLSEELEDCLVEIAHRARRSLSGFEQNPMFGRVATVADLVKLLELQPRLPKL
jgi:hypothetical protein